ncbi:hypothetical protein C2845_PM08G20530 [Panicum miliaceum]|uniref:Uncharacterized protein n=1 Tax=Panicum miliaceum TaxID=4540 RepID=A0A3L6R0V3_PANMI|nr:hypothetical protein C2845_PM08G20530 [Panicum miliaceum]
MEWIKIVVCLQDSVRSFLSGSDIRNAQNMCVQMELDRHARQEPKSLPDVLENHHALS